MSALDKARQVAGFAKAVLLVLALCWAGPAAAADAGTDAVAAAAPAPDLVPGQLPLLSVTKGPDDSESYSISLQIVALMTFLTLLPSFVIMLTGFTRIIVVFAILRQAIGLQQTPSNQILIGLALFLTIFVMAPVFQQVNEEAIAPYMASELSPQGALAQASETFKDFMLSQTRESDLDLFMRLSEAPPVAAPDELDFFVVVPAFMTSELKTAFQIGFMLFVPFLVIDMVVASVLMSMGMMMLSPLIISLPFKIMLFVLVDGWVLIMGTLASSFGLGA